MISAKISGLLTLVLLSASATSMRAYKKVYFYVTFLKRETICNGFKSTWHYLLKFFSICYTFQFKKNCYYLFEKYYLRVSREARVKKNRIYTFKKMGTKFALI